MLLYICGVCITFENKEGGEKNKKISDEDDGGSELPTSYEEKRTENIQMTNVESEK